MVSFPLFCPVVRSGNWLSRCTRHALCLLNFFPKTSCMGHMGGREGGREKGKALAEGDNEPVKMRGSGRGKFLLNGR
ncbi:hypothetical protein E2C01_086207 [Portunus trituberculatus]|uniref:Uncharacterized protein n=1 Tax=Portunus trituberculatus TaxID=210409 RepID=A0A5B7JDZ1_PORTR|nr:hypothetical protein [Portunus trituberculatus]